MIGAIVALLAGAIIRRLWPTGVLFLFLWPAAAVALTLSFLSENMAKIGQPAAITSGLIALYYLQSAAITALCFFIAFGIQKWITRDRSPAADGANDA